MKTLFFLIISFLVALPLMASDEYVAVDPASLDTVNGQKLMIVSYCIVLGMLLLYWVQMVWREHKLMKEIRSFEQNEPR